MICDNFRKEINMLHVRGETTKTLYNKPDLTAIKTTGYTL